MAWILSSASAPNNHFINKSFFFASIFFKLVSISTKKNSFLAPAESKLKVGTVHALSLHQAFVYGNFFLHFSFAFFRSNVIPYTQCTKNAHFKLLVPDRERKNWRACEIREKMKRTLKRQRMRVNEKKTKQLNYGTNPLSTHTQSHREEAGKKVCTLARSSVRLIPSQPTVQ